MKERNKRLVSIILTVILIASLSFETSPKSIKAEVAGQTDIKTLVKQALAKKIEDKFAETNTSKFQTFDENAQLKGSSTSESVRVIVQLQDKPVAENSAKTINDVKESQQQIIQKVKALTGTDIKKTFGYLVNGFSLEVKKSDISKLQAIPGIKNVTEAKVYHPDLNFAKNLTQVYSTWNNLGYKGEGLVISVVDTGIDYTHKDFRITDTSKEKLHASDIAKVGGKGKYFTDKVPYGYNFADNNQEVIDANTEEQHGTHVAGIVAANGNQDEVNSLKAVQGVAPEAQLLAMKVFSNTPGHQINAYDDDIIAAIEDSVLHGADIINMSLGSSSGFQDEDSPEQKAVKNATDKGTLVVISAGNSAISSTTSGWNVPQTNALGVVDTETVGDPGTAKDALTVASYENTNKVGSILNYTSNSENGKVFYVAAKGTPEKTLKDIHTIVDAGLGQASDFNGLDLTGKIALVKRGGITFSEKFANAQKANAAGVIIFDKDIKDGGTNDPLTSMSIDESIIIPIVGIGNSDGYKLKELINNNLQVNFTGELGSVTNSLSSDFSPFTSWGPTPSLDFKPEISAPGGNIYSTQNNNKYTTMSGTSMAAPNVAGSEALILQATKNKNLGLTGRELVEFVKDTAVNTAKVENDKTDTTVPYSPRRQGSGLIQVQDAASNNVIVKDDKGDSTVALKEIGKTTTFNLNLKNYGDTNTTYNLGNSAVLSEKIIDCAGHFKDYGIDGSNLIFSNNTVTVPAKGQAKVTVTITLPDSFKTAQFVEGFIKFSSNDTKVPSLSVPYIGFYGSWSKPNIFDAPTWDTANSLIGAESLYTKFLGSQLIPLGATKDENGNTVVDSSKIAISPDDSLAYNSTIPVLSFLRNAKSLKIDVVNKSNGEEKVLRNIYSDNEIRKDEIDSQNGDSGYNLYSNGAWDGKLYNTSTGKFETASNGQYYLRFTAKVDLQNAVPQTLYLPVKVDTVAPKVKITSSSTAKDSNKYTVTWKSSDEGVGLSNTEVVFLNGKKSDSTINYNNETGEYSSYVTLDSGVPNSIAVGTADYAGNVGIDEIAVDSPVVFDNLTDGLKLGKTSLNKDNSYKVTGKVESSVKKLKISGVNAEIDDNNNFTAKIKLSDGSNIVTVEAYDKDGKAIATKLSYNVLVRSQVPVIKITSPKIKDGVFYTEQSSIVISGNAKFEEASPDNSINVAGVQLDKSQYNANTGDFSVQVAVSGNTVISIEAVDAYGNKSTQLVEVAAIINDKPLEISFDNLSSISTLAASDVKNDTLTINGTVNHKPKVFQINGVEIAVKDNLTFSQDFKLSQGDNKFLVYAEDTDGKIASNYSYLVVYDSNAPKLTLTEPVVQADGKIYTNKDQVELKGTVQDAEHGFRLSINGNVVENSGNYNDYGQASLKDFDYKLDVKDGDIITINATDAFGNSFNEQIPVVVDKVAPKVPTVTLSTSELTNKNVSVTIVADKADTDVDKIEYSFDNKTWTGYTSPVVLEANGTIYARVTDKVGNVSDITKVNVTNIDKTAPKLPSITLNTTSPTNKDVTVTVTPDSVDQDVAKLEYSYDNSTWTEYKNPITVADNTIIYARATDKVGNVSETSKINIANIDRTLPLINISGISDGNTYYNVVTPTITVDKTFVNVTKSLDGNNFDGNNITTIGKHTLVVRAEDTAGNVAIRTVSFTIEAKDVITTKLIQTGSVIDLNVVIGFGMLLTVFGVLLVYKKKDGIE